MNAPATGSHCFSDETRDVHSVVEAIAQLETDAARIIQSQATMRAVNRALSSGSDGVLSALQFSPDHISALRQRVSNGDAAFPDYVFRNNAKLIRRLRNQAADLRRELSRAEDSEFSVSLVAPIKRAKYRCAEANVANIPFFAAYLPFAR